MIWLLLQRPAGSEQKWTAGTAPVATWPVVREEAAFSSAPRYEAGHCRNDRRRTARPAVIERDVRVRNRAAGLPRRDSTAWLLGSPPTVAHPDPIAPVLGFTKWRVCDMPAWHPIHGSGGYLRSRFAGQGPPITPATRFQKTSDEPHRHILAVAVISRVLFRAGRNQLLRAREHDLEVSLNKSGNGRKVSSTTRRPNR
jgi:hypothetical protein